MGLERFGKRGTVGLCSLNRSFCRVSLPARGGSLMQVSPVPDRYAAMVRRAAPFVASANWAVLGIACVILWYGGVIVLTVAVSFWALSPRIAADPDLVDAFYLGATPAAVRWTLASFGIYLVLLWGILRGFHRVTLRDLLGPAGPAVRSFGRVSLYLLPLFALAVVPSLNDPDVYRQFDLFRWLLVTLTVLPVLFVQISAEEAVFRGYLQSHVAALSVTLNTATRSLR